MGIDDKLYNADLFGAPMKPKAGKLATKFTYPPLTLLDARQGYWADRKRRWKALGIESEIGRPNGSSVDSRTVFAIKTGDDTFGNTSIFDPVLTELIYSWFTAPGALILDPYAGGSVRGIVASVLGRRYYGIELRPEQIEANKAQADSICEGNIPLWIAGDAEAKLPGAPPADFVFSCPPYGSLEVYSDLDADLSNMSEGDFEDKYRKIIALAAKSLKQNRFACFVVGNYRRKTGDYYDLAGLTISAFGDAGCKYYNEAILVTQFGTAPRIVENSFTPSRKMGKVHQNVLIFVKGDPRAATAWITEAEE